MLKVRKTIFEELERPIDRIRARLLGEAKMLPPAGWKQPELPADFKKDYDKALTQLKKDPTSERDKFIVQLGRMHQAFIAPDTARSLWQWKFAQTQAAERIGEIGRDALIHNVPSAQPVITDIRRYGLALVKELKKPQSVERPEAVQSFIKSFRERRPSRVFGPAPKPKPKAETKAVVAAPKAATTTTPAPTPAAPTTAKKGLSREAKIGIGVGVGTGAAALTGGGLLYHHYRKKRLEREERERSGLRESVRHVDGFVRRIEEQALAHHYPEYGHHPAIYQHPHHDPEAEEAERKRKRTRNIVLGSLGLGAGVLGTGLVLQHLRTKPTKPAHTVLPSKEEVVTPGNVTKPVVTFAEKSEKRPEDAWVRGGVWGTGVDKEGILARLTPAQIEASKKILKVGGSYGPPRDLSGRQRDFDLAGKETHHVPSHFVLMKQALEYSAARKMPYEAALQKLSTGQGLISGTAMAAHGMNPQTLSPDQFDLVMKAAEHLTKGRPIYTKKVRALQRKLIQTKEHRDRVKILGGLQGQTSLHGELPLEREKAALEKAIGQGKGTWVEPRLGRRDIRFGHHAPSVKPFTPREAFAVDTREGSGARVMHSKLREKDKAGKSIKRSPDFVRGTVPRVIKGGFSVVRTRPRAGKISGPWTVASMRRRAQETTRSPKEQKAREDALHQQYAYPTQTAGPSALPTRGALFTSPGDPDPTLSLYRGQPAVVRDTGAIHGASHRINLPPRGKVDIAEPSEEIQKLAKKTINTFIHTSEGQPRQNVDHSKVPELESLAARLYTLNMQSTDRARLEANKVARELENKLWNPRFVKRPHQAKKESWEDNVRAVLAGDQKSGTGQNLGLATETKKERERVQELLRQIWNDDALLDNINPNRQTHIPFMGKKVIKMTAGKVTVKGIGNRPDEEIDRAAYNQYIQDEVKGFREAQLGGIDKGTSPIPRAKRLLRSFTRKEEPHEFPEPQEAIPIHPQQLRAGHTAFFQRTLADRTPEKRALALRERLDKMAETHPEIAKKLIADLEKNPQTLSPELMRKLELIQSPESKRIRAEILAGVPVPTEGEKHPHLRLLPHPREKRKYVRLGKLGIPKELRERQILGPKEIARQRAKVKQAETAEKTIRDEQITKFNTDIETVQRLRDRREISADKAKEQIKDLEDRADAVRTAYSELLGSKESTIGIERAALRRVRAQSAKATADVGEYIGLPGDVVQLARYVRRHDDTLRAYRSLRADTAGKQDVPLNAENWADTLDRLKREQATKEIQLVRRKKTVTRGMEPEVQRRAERLYTKPGTIERTKTAAEIEQDKKDAALWGSGLHARLKSRLRAVERRDKILKRTLVRLKAKLQRDPTREEMLKALSSKDPDNPAILQKTKRNIDVITRRIEARQNRGKIYFLRSFSANEQAALEKHFGSRERAIEALSRSDEYLDRLGRIRDQREHQKKQGKIVRLGQKFRGDPLEYAKEGKIYRLAAPGTRGAMGFTTGDEARDIRASLRRLFPDTEKILDKVPPPPLETGPELHGKHAALFQKILGGTVGLPALQGVLRSGALHPSFASEKFLRFLDKHGNEDLKKELGTLVAGSFRTPPVKVSHPGPEPKKVPASQLLKQPYVDPTQPHVAPTGKTEYDLAREQHAEWMVWKERKDAYERYLKHGAETEPIRAGTKRHADAAAAQAHEVNQAAFKSLAKYLHQAAEKDETSKDRPKSLGLIDLGKRLLGLEQLKQEQDKIVGTDLGAMPSAETTTSIDRLLRDTARKIASGELEESRKRAVDLLIESIAGKGNAMPRIVHFDAPSGAGKSTLLGRIKEKYPHVATQDLDDFDEIARAEYVRRHPEHGSKHGWGDAKDNERWAELHAMRQAQLDRFIADNARKRMAIGGIHLEGPTAYQFPAGTEKMLLATAPSVAAWRGYRRDRGRLRDLFARYRNARRDQKDLLAAGYQPHQASEILSKVVENLGEGTAPRASRDHGTYDVEKLWDLTKGRKPVELSVHALAVASEHAKHLRSRKSGFSERRLRSTNLDYPILVDPDHGNDIIDGRHRLLKQLALGKKTILGHRLSTEDMEKAKVGA